MNTAYEIDDGENPKSSFAGSLGAAAFFDDPSYIEPEPLENKGFEINTFQDYPHLEEPGLYNELHAANPTSAGAPFGVFEPEPSPEPFLSRPGSKLAEQTQPLLLSRKTPNMSEKIISRTRSKPKAQSLQQRPTSKLGESLKSIPQGASKVAERQPMITGASAKLSTKKRKSQVDAKPLANRRKSHNFTSKALDYRRKTMYCTTDKPAIRHPLSHSLTHRPYLSEDPRFEGSDYYSPGFNNPNHRFSNTSTVNPSSGLSVGISNDFGLDNNVQIKLPENIVCEEEHAEFGQLAQLFITQEKDGGIQPGKPILLRRRHSEHWDSRPLECPPGELPSEQNEKKAQLYDELDKVKQTEKNERNNSATATISIKREPNGLSSNPNLPFQRTSVNGSIVPKVEFDTPMTTTETAQGSPSQFRNGSRNNGSTMNTGRSAGTATGGSSASKPDMDFDFGEDSKQRRTKWTSDEVLTLWKGILLHGNNWSIIKDSLPSRTYYQIKDKGRRILYNQGWKTGRTKKDAGGASNDAKVIAQGMLNRR